MGRRKQAPLPTQAAAFSIQSFCTAHHLSESSDHKMRDEGWGPDEMQVGKRVLISFEFAGRWRAAREQQAQQRVQRT